MPTKLMTVLLVAGLACLVAFRLIGSDVDENGILREPFFLLPIGSLLVLVGFAGLAGMAVSRLLRRLSG
ncbi:DUF3955 domain-containing protein [Nitratireductor alexandrii]|uniref:DUF3955 domain-containing protein n=1 Tax=Nitratireductor alexandrii TaxID=2448161 RepID=UPI001EE87505|nr:DUF3955 domain-containing protein [Nitratireductor alexandrii]